jgi:hypothetical protein
MAPRAGVEPTTCRLGGGAVVVMYAHDYAHDNCTDSLPEIGGFLLVFGASEAIKAAVLCHTMATTESLASSGLTTSCVAAVRASLAPLAVCERLLSDG